MAKKQSNIELKKSEECEEKEVIPTKFLYKRLFGKHHLRTPAGIVIIGPGDVLEAEKGSYVGPQWQCLGPVEPTSDAPDAPDAPDTSDAPILIKEEREDGFYVINAETGIDINTEPLTEEEADTIVAVSAENP